MATLTLRINDVTRDRLQLMADGMGVSVSDILRSQIDELFDQGKREASRRSVVPESMTAVDRKQLALLHRILARLVDGAADPASEENREDERLGHDGDTSYQLDRAQALEEGWTKEYDMEFYSVEPELSRRDCGLVMDLFDMFRILKHSLEKAAGELTSAEIRHLTFSGFDLSDPIEGRLLAYARWLVSDGDRWQEQAETFSRENDRGNSHSPRLGAYRRMLEAYEPIWSAVARRDGRKSYVLTADELRRVAAAAIHPDNRAGRGLA